MLKQTNETTIKPSCLISLKKWRGPGDAKELLGKGLIHIICILNFLSWPNDYTSIRVKKRQTGCKGKERTPPVWMGGNKEARTSARVVTWKVWKGNFVLDPKGSRAVGCSG